VATSAALTCSVVLTRVERNAWGANRMNHWLNWSTEAATSAFQRCGLSALILTGAMRSFRFQLRAVTLLRFAISPAYGIRLGISNPPGAARNGGYPGTLSRCRVHLPGLEKQAKTGG